MTGSLTFTVAICTWNHARLLRRTLEQMTRLVIPRDTTWELLVVNNNCTDDTDGVILDFMNRLPLRRLFEPRAGLSNARNAAVAAARGDFILWTDDDVLVSPQWLHAYAEALWRYPTAQILGGPVEPWFDGTPPHWLAKGFTIVSGAYAVREAPGQYTPITIENTPYGANMGVRHAALVRYPFDPSLGRTRTDMLGCEETEVFARILGEGGRGYWVSTARVRHFIPQSRQTLGYLWRYWRGNGLSAARIAPNRGRFRLLGSPAWLWIDATSSLVRWIGGLLISPPERWLPHMRTAAGSLGRLQGAWDRN